MQQRLRIEAVPIDHPDAVALIAQVQAEYVVLYGGRDESPIDTHEFVPPAGEFLVAYLDDEPIASGAWRSRPVPPGAQGTRAAELKRMYVAPRARRRGLAKQVLARLEADAAEHADVVVLETGVMQPEAIALYEASGYTAIPGYGHYRDSPLSRCLAKPLARVDQADSPS